jgi:hypothetical protein
MINRLKPKNSRRVPPIAVVALVVSSLSASCNHGEIVESQAATGAGRKSTIAASTGPGPVDSLAHSYMDIGSRTTVDDTRVEMSVAASGCIQTLRVAIKGPQLQSSGLTYIDTAHIQEPLLFASIDDGWLVVHTGPGISRVNLTRDTTQVDETTVTEGWGVLLSGASAQTIQTDDQYRVSAFGSDGQGIASARPRARPASAMTVACSPH